MLKLISITRFILVITALALCFHETSRGQTGPAVVTFGGTACVKPAKATTDGSGDPMAIAAASVPAYPGPHGTLLGVYTTCRLSKVRSTYKMENGDPHSSANYDGTYGGYIHAYGCTRANGKRYFSDVWGTSIYIAMCGGQTLAPYDGHMDFEGPSSHTAGGVTDATIVSVDFHDVSWSAYPHYQPGWETSEPNYPMAWYAHDGLTLTQIVAFTTAAVYIDIWTPESGWHYGKKAEFCDEEAELDVTVEYLHLQY